MPSFRRKPRSSRRSSRSPSRSPSRPGLGRRSSGLTVSGSTAGSAPARPVTRSAAPTPQAAVSAAALTPEQLMASTLGVTGAASSANLTPAQQMAQAQTPRPAAQTLSPGQQMALAQAPTVNALTPGEQMARAQQPRTTLANREVNATPILTAEQVMQNTLGRTGTASSAADQRANVSAQQALSPAEQMAQAQQLNATPVMTPAQQMALAQAPNPPQLTPGEQMALAQAPSQALTPEQLMSSTLGATGAASSAATPGGIESLMQASLGNNSGTRQPSIDALMQATLGNNSGTLNNRTNNRIEQQQLASLGNNSGTAPLDVEAMMRATLGNNSGTLNNRIEQQQLATLGNNSGTGARPLTVAEQMALAQAPNPAAVTLENRESAAQPVAPAITQDEINARRAATEQAIAARNPSPPPPPVVAPPVVAPQAPVVAAEGAPPPPPAVEQAPVVQAATGGTPPAFVTPPPPVTPPIVADAPASVRTQGSFSGIDPSIMQFFGSLLNRQQMEALRQENMVRQLVGASEQAGQNALGATAPREFTAPDINTAFGTQRPDERAPTALESGLDQFVLQQLQAQAPAFPQLTSGEQSVQDFAQSRFDAQAPERTLSSGEQLLENFAAQQFAQGQPAPRALTEGEQSLQQFAQDRFGAAAPTRPVSDFGRTLEQSLTQGLSNFGAGSDPFTASLRADFEADAGKRRAQLAEQLRGLGILRGGGATADVLGEFDANVSRGLLNVDALQQDRANDFLGQAIGFESGRRGDDLTRQALFQQGQDTAAGLLQGQNQDVGLDNLARTELAQQLQGQTAGLLAGQNQAIAADRLGQQALFQGGQNTALQALQGQNQGLRGADFDNRALFQQGQLSAAGLGQGIQGQRDARELSEADLVGNLRGAQTMPAQLAQFGAEFDLANFGEGARRFDAGLGLDRQQLAQDVADRTLSRGLTQTAPTQREQFLENQRRGVNEDLRALEGLDQAQQAQDRGFALDTGALTGRFLGQNTLARDQFGAQTSLANRGLDIERELGLGSLGNQEQQIANALRLGLGDQGIARQGLQNQLQLGQGALGNDTQQIANALRLGLGDQGIARQGLQNQLQLGQGALGNDAQQIANALLLGNRGFDIQGQALGQEQNQFNVLNQEDARRFDASRFDANNQFLANQQLAQQQQAFANLMGQGQLGLQNRALDLDQNRFNVSNQENARRFDAQRFDANNQFGANLQLAQLQQALAGELGRGELDLARQQLTQQGQQFDTSSQDARNINQNQLALALASMTGNLPQNLTGFSGRTQQAQQQDLLNEMLVAELTGQFQGAPTLQGQQFSAGLDQQNRQNQLDTLAQAIAGQQAGFPINAGFVNSMIQHLFGQGSIQQPPPPQLDPTQTQALLAKQASGQPLTPEEANQIFFLNNL